MTPVECPDCHGTGNVRSSWGENYYCQRCDTTGRVYELPNGRTTPAPRAGCKTVTHPIRFPVEGER